MRLPLGFEQTKNFCKLEMGETTSIKAHTYIAPQSTTIAKKDSTVYSGRSLLLCRVVSSSSGFHFKSTDKPGKLAKWALS